MATCPRCGNPAVRRASEEFQLLDCEFCDDVIDLVRPGVVRDGRQA